MDRMNWLKTIWDIILSFWGVTIGCVAFVKGFLVYASLILVLATLYYRHTEHRMKMKEYENNEND